MLNKFVKHIIDDCSVHKIRPSSFREKIYKHLVRLPPEDRYLRFGYTIRDEAIRKYVDKISDENSIFVIFNDDLQIIAMAHLSVEPDKVAELGFSVNKECRKKNFASKLFERAMLTAKVLNLKEMFVTFLPENNAMRESAKKFGMKITNVDGDMNGRLKLTEITGPELFEYALVHQVNIFDFILKTNLSQFRFLRRALMNEGKKKGK